MRGSNVGRRRYANDPWPERGRENDELSCSSTARSNGVSSSWWVAGCFQRLWLSLASCAARASYELCLRQSSGSGGARGWASRRTDYTYRTTGYADDSVWRRVGIVRSGWRLKANLAFL